MPYVPDPSNVAEPISGRPAGTAAAEFRALKALIAGLVLTAAGGPQVRQAVQSAVLDASGYNAALTVGAGLRPGLAATAADPYHLNFAGGFVGGKPVDTPEVFAANVVDILGADLPLSNTSYLYRDYGVQWKSTLVPPQEGNIFDRSRGSILNFDGLNGAVATIDDFGNTWTFSGNAQLTTAQFKFGTASLVLDGAGDYISSTSFTGLGNGSWEASLWFRLNAAPGVGSYFPLINFSNAANFGANLYINNTAGTIKLYMDLSSNGAANDIVTGSLGANTVWNLNQWNKIRFQYDALAGRYKAFLSLNGALETLEINFASASKICAIEKIRLGSDTPAAALFFNGWMDAMRFTRCATNTSVEVPAAVAPTITDYLHTFYSIPKMTMYEVTAASAAAGVNPTITAKTRLFVGEADTSGAAVTAIRNYAIKGQYISPQAVFPGTSASVSLAHNLGWTPRVRHLFAVNITSENGFVPDDEITLFGGNNAAYNVPVTIRCTKTNVSFATNLSTALVVNPKAGGDAAGLTPAKWQYRVEVQRGW